MHVLFNHIVNYLCKALIIISFFWGTNAYAERSVKEIIEGRKALFSKNYNTAKKVQALSSSSDFDEAKKLMQEMSENYKSLLKMFPENTKEGFKTGSLPTIWEDKESFNTLMQKSSDDMIKLTSVIETTDDINGTIRKLMWGNCKACHSKYREEH